MGITDSVCVVLLVRETGGTSVYRYDFVRDLKDSLSVGIYSVQFPCVFLESTPAFSLVVWCVIDIAVPSRESRLEVEEGL